MKRLALITLIAMSLSSCSDRTRVNCERQRNKALNAVATTIQIGGGRCG
jgi:PBP1b-binding outer membrane lipoprotein LpoB